MRAFLAITPSKEFIKKANTFIKELMLNYPHQLRITQAHNLHITLHFFDDLKKEHLPQLTAALQNITNNFSTIPITVSKKLLLPSKQNATVLAWKIKTSKELLQIKMLIDTLLASYGYPIEKQEFLPHITIARSKNTQLLHEIELPNLEHSFNVQELVLFESSPQKGEFHYKVVEIISFPAYLPP